MDFESLSYEYEYLGDGNREDIIGVPVQPENTNHCILTIISPDGESEQFDFWNSLANPCDTSDEMIERAVFSVMDEGLCAAWEDWETVEGYDDYYVQEVMKRSMCDIWEKLQNIGFDADDLCAVLNGDIELGIA